MAAPDAPDKGVGKALPIMYNVSHEEFSDLTDELTGAEPGSVKGANRNVAAMLQRLKRITAIHSSAETPVSGPGTVPKIVACECSGAIDCWSRLAAPYLFVTPCAGQVS